ncbi:HBS1 N-terminus-domain-containing protein [Cokeromyces recurvatus]|uniref:HBS1 N-terminus-domain-containing protein n=1 Tax=Cokeromyces recurvatus TaxID=90255 RepID=UPI002220AAB1|nr:HBS1 N-terminus-domain-containing protein [Cokeromyces recurvatus]KAI7901246.1 HBS1 N-terminus-domain-containing protein [Cokeromyces recurvatus]
MSRHRAVRNLDIDDILDEDEYDSEYDENQFDEDELSNEDLDKLDEGLAQVYSVIGEDTILSAKEIREALWYYYFDIDETIEWALGKLDSCFEVINIFTNLFGV